MASPESVYAPLMQTVLSVRNAYFCYEPLHEEFCHDCGALAAEVAFEMYISTAEWLVFFFSMLVQLTVIYK